MQCISTISMIMLWNGTKSTEFKPSKGIRQGDMISPYLFVLCLDKLSCIILKEIRLGTKNP